jgi:predicted  nucleic acid-binding Zn-ribbon protein
MKELFLAKEKECNHLKQKVILLKKELDEASSQLVIAEYNREKDLEDQRLRFDQEIITLQQLIQESLDESSMGSSEIKRLTEENERFKQEIITLKDSILQHQVIFKKIL